jgi:hypothetical protein
MIDSVVVKTSNHLQVSTCGFPPWRIEKHHFIRINVIDSVVVNLWYHSWQVLTCKHMLLLTQVYKSYFGNLRLTTRYQFTYAATSGYSFMIYCDSLYFIKILVLLNAKIIMGKCDFFRSKKDA